MLSAYQREGGGVRRQERRRRRNHLPDLQDVVF
jgi:hypothetical protein